jgi:hypothetical protein
MLLTDSVPTEYWWVWHWLDQQRSSDSFYELSPLCHSKREYCGVEGVERNLVTEERERQRERASSRLAASTSRIQNCRTVSHPLSFGGYRAVVPRNFWVATISSVCRSSGSWPRIASPRLASPRPAPPRTTPHRTASLKSDVLLRYKI